MPSPLEILATGRFIRLVRRGRWEFADRPGVHGIVAIVAVTADRRILLVEQHREAVGRACIELPAGLAGDVDGAADENLVAAAQRELLEETGYVAARFERLTEGPPSAGLSAEVITFFRAQGLTRRHAGGGDESEGITVHEPPLAEIDAWLEAQTARGVYVDPKVYTGLYFAVPRR